MGRKVKCKVSQCKCDKCKKKRRKRRKIASKILLAFWIAWVGLTIFYAYFLWDDQESATELCEEEGLKVEDFKYNKTLNPFDNEEYLYVYCKGCAEAPCIEEIRRIL